MNFNTARDPNDLKIIFCSTATTARSINSDEQDDESTFSKQDLQQILGDIQTTCYNHTGSNATYESIVSHIYAIPVCVMMNWDVQNFIEDVENLNSFTRYWFFPKYSLTA